MRPTVQNYEQHAAQAEQPAREEERERKTTQRNEDDALVLEQLQAKIRVLELENQRMKDEAKSQREPHELKVKEAE